jgi:plasmid stabilization system protein ParE
MAYEVVWSPRAVDDVQAIAAYIADVVHGKRPVELEIQP